MKKSLLALAVLGAFAGAASAQSSSVTISGLLDQAVGKRVGSANNELADTAGSRIAFRGYEDLGGGMAAIFGFEHRFRPENGNTGPGVSPTSNNSTRFWEGYSFVGVRSQFGTVTLGRQYTSSFLLVQNQVDPFEGETVGALRDFGMALDSTLTSTLALNPANGAVIGLGNNVAGQIRVSNALKYAISFSGVSLSADVAESLTPAGTAMPANQNKPISLAASYAGGPFWIGASYEDPQGQYDEQFNAGIRFVFGPATLSAGLSDGTNRANQDTSSFLLGAKFAVGSGDIKLGYAELKVNNVKYNERFGVGYHHNLSKRTKIFVDYAYDANGWNAASLYAANAAVRGETSGYDLGIQHKF